MKTTDKLDVKEIEYEIYSYIMQDFAEYFNNRMNVYKGVVNYLDTITNHHLITTTTDNIYEEYKTFCERENISCLTPKSFAKVMTGMCGFIITRTSHRNGKDKNGKEIRKFETYYEMGGKNANS